MTLKSVTPNSLALPTLQLMQARRINHSTLHTYWGPSLGVDTPHILFLGWGAPHVTRLRVKVELCDFSKAYTAGAQRGKGVRRGPV